MISEFFLSIIWAIIKPFLDMLPTVQWTVEYSAYATFLDILDAIAYLLPVADVAAMIAIMFGVHLVRIVISFIKTIWDLLPIF